MKLEYRIKKFIYKFSKLFLRIFIFFTIVSVFSVSALAVTEKYSKFSDFLGENGSAQIFGGSATSGNLVSLGDFSGTSANRMVVSASSTDNLIRSCRVKISDADALSFKITDDITQILITQHIAISGLTSKPNSPYDNMPIAVLEVFTADYKVRTVTVQASSAVKNVDIGGSVSQSYYIEYDLSTYFDVSGLNGDISSLTYQFYNFVPNSQTKIVINPVGYINSSNGISVFRSGGTVAEAPIYDAPDSTTLDDYSSKEQEILDSGDSSVSGYDINGNPKTTTPKQEASDILKSLPGLSYWTLRLQGISGGINKFLSKVSNIRSLLSFSLALGLFGFIFNIVPYLVRRK